MQLPRANIQSPCHTIYSFASEILQQKRNNNDDFFFRVRDGGRDAGAVDTNIATCEATNHTHSNDANSIPETASNGVITNIATGEATNHTHPHNANSTPKTVFTNAMDTNTTATVLPHLSSDEILGHMALRGHLQSGSQDDLKTLVLQHSGTQKLHPIHGGTTMSYHDLLNLIALEKAPDDPLTAGEHDLLQLPPDDTTKEVYKNRTTGIYIHEHAALLLAKKKYPVAYSVIKAAANYARSKTPKSTFHGSGCVQTFGLDSSSPLSTANGISEILMHYSAKSQAN